MKIREKLQELTSSQEELDSLLSLDNLYITRGYRPDDNNLKSMSTEYCDWICKLRGPYEGPAKIANNKNDHDWCHGYVYSVDNENVDKFEKDGMLFAFKHGYTFEKIDISKQLDEERRQHFVTLFEDQ